jgi:hypothetical protein
MKMDGSSPSKTTFAESLGSSGKGLNNSQSKDKERPPGIPAFMVNTTSWQSKEKRPLPERPPTDPGFKFS